MDITERLLRNEIHHLGEDLKALSQEFILVQKFLKHEYGEKFATFRAKYQPPTATQENDWAEQPTRNKKPVIQDTDESDVVAELMLNGPRIVAAYSQFKQESKEENEGDSSAAAGKKRTYIRKGPNPVKEIVKKVETMPKRGRGRPKKNPSDVSPIKGIQNKKATYKDVYSDSEEESKTKRYIQKTMRRCGDLSDDDEDEDDSHRHSKRRKISVNTEDDETSPVKVYTSRIKIKSEPAEKPTARKSTGGIQRLSSAFSIVNPSSGYKTTAAKITKKIMVGRRKGVGRPRKVLGAGPGPGRPPKGGRGVGRPPKHTGVRRPPKYTGVGRPPKDTGVGSPPKCTNRKRNSVWKYFEYIGTTDRSHCLVPGCQKSLKQKFTSNLLKHLEIHHNTIYIEVVEEEARRKYDLATAAETAEESTYSKINISNNNSAEDDEEKNRDLDSSDNHIDDEYNGNEVDIEEDTNPNFTNCFISPDFNSTNNE